MIEEKDYVKIEEARRFATQAHSSIDQMRKYTGESYIVHPEKVAYLVEIVGGTADMICAAWLHDVLEDVAPTMPQYGEKSIEDKFGKNVLDLVQSLTKDNTPGNRKERVEREIIRFAESSPAVQTIKLADLIDNSRSIIQYDQKFAVTYLKEKRLMMKSLTQGDGILLTIAMDILSRNGY